MFLDRDSLSMQHAWPEHLHSSQAEEGRGGMQEQNTKLKPTRQQKNLIENKAKTQRDS